MAEVLDEVADAAILVLVAVCGLTLLAAELVGIYVVASWLIGF